MAATHAGSFTRCPVRGSSSCPQTRQSAIENCSCTRISTKRQGSVTWQSSSRRQNRILDGRGKVVRFQPAVRAVLDTNDTVPAGTSQGTGEDLPPAGCSRIKVELSRPLGLVLEESKDGRIFVAKIVPGGNAAKAAAIEVGDELIATSAVVYNSEMDYGGVKVRKGQEVVRLAVRGERFDTVMAAISTHPAVIKVTLELQKCQK